MRTVYLFFVSLFLQFLQEGQQERHRDAEGEAIGDGLAQFDAAQADRKSTRLNSSHMPKSRMPSSA